MSKYTYTHTHTHPACTHTHTLRTHTHTHTLCLPPSSHHKTHLTSSKKNYKELPRDNYSTCVGVDIPEGVLILGHGDTLTYNAVLCFSLKTCSSTRVRKGKAVSLPSALSVRQEPYE